MDNKQIKDGVGNLFTQRMRDRSPSGDGSLMQSWHLMTQVPIEYGFGGIYQHCGKSGAMAAGLAAGAVIYSFRWHADLTAMIRRVRLSAWTLGTPFAADLASFDIYAARTFTAQYGAGNQANLFGESAQLRTDMATSQANIMLAATAELTAGVCILDPAPLHTRTIPAPVAASTLFALEPLTIFEKLQGEHPLTLATDEGFVIKATVPATGLWSFAVTTEWDEVSLA